MTLVIDQPKLQQYRIQNLLFNPTAQKIHPKLEKQWDDSYVGEKIVTRRVRLYPNVEKEEVRNLRSVEQKLMETINQVHCRVAREIQLALLGPCSQHGCKRTLECKDPYHRPFPKFIKDIGSSTWITAEEGKGT
jgi:hypothetical protein